ncbi:MAG: glycosyl hydrolase, partial [Bacteroidota bacterium]
GNTVRHLDAGTSAGLQRIVWDFHYATPAPYNNRYTPGPDELFGGSEKGHLAAPGEYTATLYKSQNGVLTALTAPQPFAVKSLGNTTIPNNPDEYVAFCTRVAELRKAVSAANELTNGIAQRLDAIRQVIPDMPADPSVELAEAHRLQDVLNTLNRKLYGDSSKARREMETEPSINDRVGTVQYALFESTSEIPQMYRDSFAIASIQFTQFLSDLRKLDTEVRALEDRMEIGGAPYT